MMRVRKTKGMILPVILGLLLALPMWALANDTNNEPNIDALKTMRQLQNQNTQLANIKATAKQMSATEEQQRMLRLSNVLSKITADKPIDLNTTYRFDHHGSGFSAPQTATQGLRELSYGHGALKNANDSLYYNFLTGMNSADSVGMDVRITGNEGTNFGNEGASWGDPSLLYLHMSPGQLSDVGDGVEPIDGSNADYSTVSWDANGYRPLQIGDIYVVYTRTSHMYVALEVTYVEEWNQYFEFDYMIQTDGTHLFGEFTSMLDLTVNGVYGDTLEIGSNPYFEITLDSDPYGELGIFYDFDHNGLWDSDPLIEFYEFMDNDVNDEDPADGIFGFTYTDEMAEGINYLAEDLLFIAFSAGDYAEVPVQFYSEPTNYSVSGTITDDVDRSPLEGIIVWAVYEWSDQPAIVGITDESGMYHLDLPDSGMVLVGTDDHFGVTEGLFPDPPEQFVMVMGHADGIDFTYTMPTSGIAGVVTDQEGNTLEGIEIEAYNNGPSHYGISDEDGNYYIPVNPGTYEVEVNWSSLPDPYILPFAESVDVGDFADANLDLTLYYPNGIIIGTVYLDDEPYPHAMVYGHMDIYGYSITEAGDNGEYELPVYDDNGSSYDLHVWTGDNQEIIQISQNWGVPAGTVGEDIYLSTVSGGLYGYFMNAETGEPIMGSDEVGMMLRDVYTGMEYYSGPDYDGYYEIHVPPGMYELNAGGMDWAFLEPDSVMIDEDLLLYDIYLSPLNFESSISGVVRDMDGTPIPYAQVQIGNDGWGTGMMTGPDGYYYFDLQPGYYYMHAWAEGYFEEYFDLEIQYGENYQDIYLEPFESDGVIYGMVYSTFDGMPLAGADVYAYGGDMGFMFQTDDSGQYWFDLPNGVYDIVVEHEGYMPFWGLGYEVNDDTLQLDIPLDLPDGGLEGFVYDDMGYSIGGAEILMVSMTDSIGFWDISDPNGSYSIPARNGEYQVFANAEGFEPANLGMVTIDNDFVWMDITLFPRQFATPPEIAFIVDQPWDQGRNVRMQFWPGGTEWGPFMGYSVWRLTNTPMGEILDFVEYLPNHDLEAYNLVLPTLVDSNAYTTPDQYLTGFLVTGHWDAYGYIDGMPSAGYSIDNIHPGIPGDLLLMGSSDEGVDLGWGTSMDDDFAYFEVHRATNPDFTDASIEMTTETMHHDADVTVGQTYYYMITAVDANGNVSEGTNMVTTSIVALDDLRSLPTAFGLSQNYPNPFNPTTSIEFALPKASQVSLEIYNLLGQKVRTLVNAYVPAGYVSTSWDGLDQQGNEVSSGTYIYRLQTAENSFSKKMVLMK